MNCRMQGPFYSTYIKSAKKHWIGLGLFCTRSACSGWVQFIELDNHMLLDLRCTYLNFVDWIKITSNGSYDDCSRIYLFLKSRLGKQLTEPTGAPKLARFALCNMFSACTHPNVKEEVLVILWPKWTTENCSGNDCLWDGTWLPKRPSNNTLGTTIRHRIVPPGNG